MLASIGIKLRHNNRLLILLLFKRTYNRGVIALHLAAIELLEPEYRIFDVLFVLNQELFVLLVLYHQRICFPGPASKPLQST